MLDKLSPAQSATSRYSKVVACRVHVFHFFLIDRRPGLLVVMHFQESEVLHQCRSLLWTSLGIQNDPLKERFVFRRMSIPKGIQGLSETCFKTKAASRHKLEQVFLHVGTTDFVHRLRI